MGGGKKRGTAVDPAGVWPQPGPRGALEPGRHPRVAKASVTLYPLLTGWRLVPKEGIASQVFLCLEEGDSPEKGEDVQL